MIWTPRPEQAYAYKWGLDHPYSGLLLDMGLGKTSISLTIIDRLLFHDFSIGIVLIVAPKKVLENVWDAEIEQWDHLKHLKLVKIHGTQKERFAALKQKGNIYIISQDNIAWLVAHWASAWPYEMLIIDESAGFKNHDSKRFRAIRTIRPFCRRVIILTGTPVPNGLADLWSQIYCLDQGERLGKHITDYRRNYLTPLPSPGFETRKYDVTEENEKRIYSKVGDIVISMKKEDYVKLPPRFDLTDSITLPKDVYARYIEFERTQVLKAWEDAQHDIAAINAAALTMKLRQFANGAVYDNELNKNWILAHDEKIDTLEEIIKSVQSEGRQILVSYQFKHDLERLKKRFGGSDLDVAKWNAKKASVMYLQAGGGVGLNLQAGGSHIAWFGMDYNLLNWDQFNARLHRTGQPEPVYIHKLICIGTIDVDVNRAIVRKSAGQNAMLEAVKARIDLYIR